MSRVIRAKDLTIAYDNGRNEVIRHATFDIHQGDFVFITGVSGSGKSTLLKSLYGQIRPKSGDLEVGGVDMMRVKPRKLQDIRRHMGIVFQDYKLINEWTVAKNIVLPLMIGGYSEEIQKRQLEKLLKHVKLSGYEQRYPLELSGGEQQRVGVARALAKTPVMILADEPTGNLDDYSSSLIWELLEGACSQFNTTVLVVTHRLPSVFSLPYRHFVIEDRGVYEL